MAVGDLAGLAEADPRHRLCPSAPSGAAGSGPTPRAQSGRRRPGVRRGIPVTSVARTLLDLAWKLSGDQLRRALERAEDLGLFDLDELRAVVERNRGHQGAKRLRLALAAYEPRRFTRSEFERRFVDHLVRSGLPRPATGWNEAGYELDVYWPDLGFGIELDTYETHGTREAFERDHARDLALTLADIETIRISERQFLGNPNEITTYIATLLDRRMRST